MSSVLRQPFATDGSSRIEKQIIEESCHDVPYFSPACTHVLTRLLTVFQNTRMEQSGQPVIPLNAEEILLSGSSANLSVVTELRTFTWEWLFDKLETIFVNMKLLCCIELATGLSYQFL
jgi:hypothetical protein